jgi:hypothetical protein
VLFNSPANRYGKIIVLMARNNQRLFRKPLTFVLKNIMDSTIKINETLKRIEEYSFTPNAIFLYPLNEYINDLKSCFNYQSDNYQFNAYIKNKLLADFDFDITICQNQNRKKLNEEDVNTIKDGVTTWHNHFKEACKFYSVSLFST